MSGTRPEHIAPPEIFYNDTEARKYAQNSRILEIQSAMSERAIELLCLPRMYLDDDTPTVESRRRRVAAQAAADDSSDDSDDDDSDMDDSDDDGDADSASGSKKQVRFAKQTSEASAPDDKRRRNPAFVPQFVLDVGCGSGISGQVLREMGHHWIGLDISEHMLGVAVERHAEGDMFLQDMGQGVSFRVGMFDAVISISALQWLCQSDAADQIPQKRLSRFFSSLYRCVKKGGRCVFQFYPESARHMEMITNSAMKAGFSGGIVVDYPNSTRAKKYFLCLFAGVPEKDVKMPEAKQDEHMVPGQIRNYESKQSRDEKYGRGGKGKNRSGLKGTKGWIVRKKERDLRRGKEVRPTTKNSGKQRKPRF